MATEHHPDEDQIHVRRRTHDARSSLAASKKSWGIPGVTWKQRLAIAMMADR